MMMMLMMMGGPAQGPGTDEGPRPKRGAGPRTEPTWGTREAGPGTGNHGEEKEEMMMLIIMMIIIMIMTM